MITGIVNNYLEAIVTLPASLVKALGLPFLRSSRTLLADGRESEFDIHEATAEWDGQPRRILVDTAETDPLLGMALMEGYELCVQVRPGGRVYITALPEVLNEEPEPVIA